jgi:hypothetical protein
MTCIFINTFHSTSWYMAEWKPDNDAINNSIKENCLLLADE